MKPHARRRIPYPVLLALLVLVCFVLPRWFYGLRLAMVELRYGGIILLLVAALLWVVLRAPGRKD